MGTKREQIIEILGRIGSPISLDDVDSPTFWLEEAADAILALPLEVPSDKEIENHLWDEIHIPLSQKEIDNNTNSYKTYMETLFWMRWMRDEIVERNK